MVNKIGLKGYTPPLRFSRIFASVIFFIRKAIFRNLLSSPKPVAAKPQRISTAGYTMVEMVVILSLVTAISSMVLFSFTGLNEGAALNRSARELALAIRQAQNMSLAVTQISVGSPPTAQIPPAVGVRLNTAEPNIYFLFADLPIVDNKYSGESEKIPGTQVTFERRVKINKIIDESGALYPAAHIIFAAPEATVILSNAAGSEFGDRVEIELISPSGFSKKTVTVRTSGQINIK